MVGVISEIAAKYTVKCIELEVNPVIVNIRESSMSNKSITLRSKSRDILASYDLSRGQFTRLKGRRFGFFYFR